MMPTSCPYSSGVLHPAPDPPSLCRGTLLMRPQNVDARLILVPPQWVLRPRGAPHTRAVSCPVKSTLYTAYRQCGKSSRYHAIATSRLSASGHDHREMASALGDTRSC